MSFLVKLLLDSLLPRTLNWRKHPYRALLRAEVLTTAKDESYLWIIWAFCGNSKINRDDNVKT
jgi:hypothetical protein